MKKIKLLVSFFIWFWAKNKVQCFISMTSYKIHSIKNNKKLSFIIEWDDAEKIKENISQDGYIVLTIEQLQEEKNKIPRFIFEWLKENKSRIQGKVDAIDIFSAYEILRDDYQYTILKLYPADVTNEREQEIIFNNILQIFPEAVKKEKEPMKNKTMTELEVLKKYLEILSNIVNKSELTNKDILLYDMRRVQMVNSVSSMEEVIKKTIKTLYNKSTVEKKKQIYSLIIPITKHLKIFLFPPWFFQMVIYMQSISYMFTLLFLWPKKDNKEKIIKKISPSRISFLQKDDSPEKKIFTNKNISFLLKKKYRSSWLDIFKFEGSYFYFYSLLRQNKSLFWIKRIQEYLGITSLYTCFFLVFWIIITGTIFTPQFLFFNGFIVLIMSIISLSLVFFFKEI